MWLSWLGVCLLKPVEVERIIFQASKHNLKPKWKFRHSRIKSALRSLNLTTYFKPFNILRGKLVHVKDKTPREKRFNPVYGIKCGKRECNATYVGETRQPLSATLRVYFFGKNPDPDTESKTGFFVSLVKSKNGLWIQWICSLRGFNGLIWIRILRIRRFCISLGKDSKKNTCGKQSSR